MVYAGSSIQYLKLDATGQHVVEIQRAQAAKRADQANQAKIDGHSVAVPFMLGDEFAEGAVSPRLNWFGASHTTTPHT